MKEESKTRPWAALAVAVMFVLASLVSAAPARAAEERTVIPMGRAVGIKLFSDGVMVVGFSEVAGAEGSSAPARDCGLREGDIITHINREEVDSIEEVQSVLQEVGGKPMSIRAVRDDKTVQLTAQAVQCGSDGQYKLGGVDPRLHGGDRHPHLLRARYRAVRRFGPRHQRRGHRPAHAPPVRLHHVFGGHRCEEGGKGSPPASSTARFR